MKPRVIRIVFKTVQGYVDMYDWLKNNNINHKFYMLYLSNQGIDIRKFEPDRFTFHPDYIELYSDEDVVAFKLTFNV